MRTRKAILAFSFLLFLVVPSTLAQKKITALEAKDHINELATVCGNVASARFSASTKGQPTFLNLETPYPNQVFTVVIWGSDRTKFGTPETAYKGKRICVTGKIESFRGVPEIVAADPQQIKTEFKKETQETPFLFRSLSISFNHSYPGIDRVDRLWFYLKYDRLPNYAPTAVSKLRSTVELEATRST